MFFRSFVRSFVGEKKKPLNTFSGVGTRKQLALPVNKAHYVVREIRRTEVEHPRKEREELEQPGGRRGVVASQREQSRTWRTNKGRTVLLRLGASGGVTRNSESIKMMDLRAGGWVGGWGVL